MSWTQHTDSIGSRINRAAWRWKFRAKLRQAAKAAKIKKNFPVTASPASRRAAAPTPADTNKTGDTTLAGQF